ncbi:hypothetical protein [Arthrobacter sp. MMS18-M83]|uniref:hypothetical protein n=1 Tax=Arthrobacter sp. MMS18-M83 TaxID=2996261 RepID=UPI00227A8AE2|nr:hypothetical protein [Arthrobacter sp. MMS18-M83]WAH95410.1 hypothetical protein OW521_13170 [Arthrobacter sp. MMS18-M83]
MEDPTTLALNLTFFGTLGLASIMFLALGFLMVITLVLAGVVKLLSIILLAMVGIFPKRNTVPVVHLPPRPRRVPTLAESVESTMADAGSLGTGAAAPEKPRLGVLRTTKLLWSAGWTAFRSFPWKRLVDPRTWPKPAQVKARIATAATAVATTQAKEHPFVVAVKPDPPVLNSQWAAAVAEADARAAARDAERAQETPAQEATPHEIVAPVRERQEDPHGGKPVSSGRVTASAGARPRA